MDTDTLLITNCAPTEEEHEELQRQAATYNKKLVIFNRRISKLEAKLESTKIKRSELFETAMPFLRPLAPFRRLPQDIIREIFIACLDPETNPTMSKKEAPTHPNLQWIAMDCSHDSAALGCNPHPDYRLRTILHIRSGTVCHGQTS